MRQTTQIFNDIMDERCQAVQHYFDAVELEER